MLFLFLFRGLISYLNALLSPSTLLVWKPMSGSLKKFEGFTVWCSKLLFKQAFFVCFQPSVEIIEPVRTYLSKNFCKVSSLRLLTRNYKHLLSCHYPHTFYAAISVIFPFSELCFIYFYNVIRDQP
ncbi:hypothetical protein H311_02655 [Anncaliia algerae PRA109]|nr:hypothetical protein H311_02655 [Anncaliia algerae PRA109]